MVNPPWQRWAIYHTHPTSTNCTSDVTEPRNILYYIDISSYVLVSNGLDIGPDRSRFLRMLLNQRFFYLVGRNKN